MIFRARSGRSLTAPASGRVGSGSGGCGGGSGLTRAPSLTAPAPVLAAPFCASTIVCVASACATGAAVVHHHPSHPLSYPRHARGAAVSTRASPDGIAAAAAASAAPVAVSSSSPVQPPPSDEEQRRQLLDYVIGGPLLASCSLTPESVRASADEWCALGARLAQQLGFAPPPAAAAAAPPNAAPRVAFSSLDAAQRLRIYRYYLPVFFWARAQLDRHAREHGGGQSSSSPPPLVLGISAPQGCGKTTLTEQLTELFSALGYRVAGVSIDDFYLTRGQQSALAQSHPGNRLLELRGNAGSHDLGLGEACLAALRGCTSAGKQVAVPRYDKSAFGGKGDRAPESEWPRFEGPLQLVLFEGWMLGFRPSSGGGPLSGGGGMLTAEERRDLAPVDAALRSYAGAWDRFVDSWLVVRVGDPRWVFAWRLQAEQAMRARGKAGMSDEAVADFVSRYLPAYSAYLPSLYAEGPTTARPGRTLVVEVDEARSPVERQPALPDGLKG